MNPEDYTDKALASMYRAIRIQLESQATLNLQLRKELEELKAQKPENNGELKKTILEAIDKLNEREDKQDEEVRHAHARIEKIKELMLKHISRRKTNPLPNPEEPTDANLVTKP